MDKKKEKLNQKMEELKSGIKDKIKDFVTNSNEIKEFLAFRRKYFYNYSIRNSILIFRQKPNATYVTGYNKWKELGYKVKEGEKGIAILVPLIKKRENKNRDNESKIESSKDDNKDKSESSFVCGFRYGYVFDLSQVEGTEKATELPSIDVQMKLGDTTTYSQEEIFSSTKKVVEQYCQIEIENGLSVYGSTDGKKISLKSNTNLVDMSSVLVHEFVHFDNHFKTKEKLKKSLVEVEAELGSLIFGSYFDLDVTGSYKYLSAYIKDEIDDHFNVALATVEKLLYGYEDKKGIATLLEKDKAA